ncbi:MAG: cellulose synthase operon protein YhjQ/BcsQ [Gemmatales bacterium]|nr:pilus assembly protein CpaE [Gemmatales bacterium]MCS7161088.1 pilus assembly protein CpaE [Gemmatales bacterium]MDW8176291.1 cellulose synthase operon protein YhjQ/BcsQ [Gemmatales bacterium]MDW8223187.1 cellulose synthase operon protein YhjQ/BcsQ [Gemmatales bacterium]
MSVSDWVRLALVDPSDQTRDSLRDALLGLDTLWLEAECARYEFFPDVVRQARPDIALVVMDSNPQAALSLIQQLSQEFPHMGILAASSRTDGPFILQTLRSGAKEFLTLPVALDELVAALQRVRQQLAPVENNGQPLAPSSQIIAVIGSRGGIGCTSIGINLGVALAQNPNHNVVFVDLDLALGDADVTLDLIPSYTLADVALSVERLDMTLLRRSLVRHSTGLSLLPHPVQLEDAAAIQEEQISRVLGLLRAAFTHVIVDLSKGYRPTDLAALRHADVILLVTQLELTALRNAVRLLLSLQSFEGLDQRVRVILNRVGADHQEITVKKAEETLGRPVFWQIPNDAKAMLASRNLGVPLLQHAPRSKVWQSIQDLAKALCGEPVPPEAAAVKKTRKGFSLFS